MSKYKLVPVDPAPEMMEAGAEGCGQDLDRDEARGRAFVAYKVMIAAAPAVQGEPVAFCEDAALSIAERKRFELWYNSYYDMELIAGPDDVEAAWEIWKAAIDGTPAHPIGYVGFSNDGEINKFRTGKFGSGHPVYLSPKAACRKQGGEQ